MPRPKNPKPNERKAPIISAEMASKAQHAALLKRVARLEARVDALVAQLGSAISFGYEEPA